MYKNITYEQIQSKQLMDPFHKYVYKGVFRLKETMSVQHETLFAAVLGTIQKVIKLILGNDLLKELNEPRARRRTEQYHSKTFFVLWILMGFLVKLFNILRFKLYKISLCIH